MNKTKIEWTDMTWNPVTGCLHRCPYCYANRQAERFSGYDPLYNTNFDFESGCYIIKKPMYKRDATGIVRKAPFPFEFAPTFHTYKLEEPLRRKKPTTIFVCSMADLFGEWVPNEWIQEVFKACAKAPWHTYIFLTKNPARYMDLILEGILKPEPNFWFGSTVTVPEDPFFYCDGMNTFVSIEPIMAQFPDDENNMIRNIKWVIIGAETGNRSGKVIPEREWITGLVKQCHEAKTPVFLKDSVQKIMGPDYDLRPLQQFPENMKGAKEA